MSRSLVAIMAFAIGAILCSADGARAGGLLASASSPGGAGTGLNLIVREVRATPATARVGDKIRIDMIVENQGGEGAGTVTSRVYANRRSVASQLFHYDITGGTLYRETLFWDTTGAAPGEYRLRGEVYIHYDTSPFDNHLDLSQPVVLVGSGAPLPAGKDGGGTAVTRDPRYRPPATERDEGAGQPKGTGY